MRDYTGKTIYVGIDVHKKTYSLTALCEGIIIKQDTIEASPKVLVKYFDRFYGAEIFSCYEAGFSGFDLHRYLETHLYKNIVVHAASIEIASRERTKTDKRDSLKLATQLAANRLRGIHVPSQEREEYRSLTRLREKFVQEKKRTGNQLKMLLHQFGLLSKEMDKKLSIKWLKSLEKLNISLKLKNIIDNYAQHWLYLSVRIKEVDKKIKLQAKEDFELEEIYLSFSGVGETSARILANELEDMSQFRNEKALFSYLGLTPREYSSGEHVRLGHISRQGKPILRKILVQIAWRAIKLDQELLEIFLKISAKSGKKRAIVAIAKKIAGRMRACLKKREKYIIRDKITDVAAS